MDNIRDLLSISEKEYGIKLMTPPYRYSDALHKNMEMDKHCIICERSIGLFEGVFTNEKNECICPQCHYEHIAGVNIATFEWFRYLNLEMRENLNMNWITTKEGNLIDFTFWLKNQPRLMNEYYSALQNPDEKGFPRVNGFYLPQNLETKALNLWITEIGININDCTFRTLDTFPNFQNKFEDILVIYNNPDKTHANRDGSPLIMKMNPISNILGENIMGSIVFINRYLVTNDVLDQSYASRAPQSMPNV